MGTVHYRLELQETSAGTGFFSPIPQAAPSLAAGLTYLCRHPTDSFMHSYLLAGLKRQDADAVGRLLDGGGAEHAAIRALLLEAVLVYDHLGSLRKRFKRHDHRTMTAATPLILLRSEGLADQSLHRQWSAWFGANMTRHRPLPSPDKIGLADPFRGDDAGEPEYAPEAHLSVVAGVVPSGGGRGGPPRPPLAQTIAKAQARLEALDIFEGGEMRHQASLSPIALLRKWRFSHAVTSGPLKYTLSGIQTSYGRGLTLESARASCLMEVVERCSAFAGVTDRRVMGSLRPHPLIHGRRSQLVADGYPLLDPNRLRLEVPYEDDALYWMEGELCTTSGPRPLWVPVQCIYLFSNLDERALFSGLGSTGLASGNTMAEARLSALYELLERDSEAISPYHPSRCFRVYAHDGQIQGLLEDYRMRGIHLVFQDISPAFGIPCCSCCVTHADGTVARGGGADLNGRRAVLSALTETPYPYPVGPPSLPAPPDLPWLDVEALPDYSTGSPQTDLLLVEQTLLANGREPIYVDLTRKDVGIPVVRALIPGFELMADFDRHTRISPRLFNNYLKIHVK